MGFANSVIGGAAALIRAAIKSPNFVTGSTGWQVSKDGSAEFNNLSIRGTFNGTNYVVSASGEFFYSGTPAGGNLSASVIPGTVNVTDSFGNVALPGISVYQGFAVNNVALNMQAGILTFYSWNGASWGVGASVDWTPVNGFTELINSAFRSISGTSATPTLITTDNWTTVTTFTGNFGAGSPAPQYALEPTGTGGVANIRLRGQVLATGANAADTAMFNVGYTFARNQDYVTPTNASGYTAGQRVIRVASSGNVRLEPASSNTNFVLLDGIVAPMS